MILTLDLSADRALFHQIVDGVKRALVDGQLDPGAALPPGRELAGVLDAVSYTHLTLPTICSV